MSSPEVASSASPPSAPPPTATESPYIRLSSLNNPPKSTPPASVDIYQKVGLEKRVPTPGNISGSLSLPPSNHNTHHQLSFPTNVSSSTVPPNISLRPDEETNPFVVTVRQSPGRGERIIGVNKSPTSVNFRGKSGPRLALYRSNSSLDLLDRDNYLLHHHSHLHQQRLKLAEQVRSQQQTGSGQQSTNSPLTRASIGGITTHSHAHQEKIQTGSCFPRRKDFGSHGSIDVLSIGSGGGYKPERSGSVGNAGNFLSILNSREREVAAAPVVLQPGSKITVDSSSKKEGSKEMEKSKVGLRESASPRLRLKLQKLWEHKDNGSNGSSSGGSKEGKHQQVVVATTSSGVKEKEGLFRKLRGSSSLSGGTTSRNTNAKSLPEGVKFEVLSLNEDQMETDSGYGKVTLRQGNGAERYRRRVLSHYDCQSVCANIYEAAKQRGLLSRRRNTTTGASAASLAQRPHSTINNGLLSASSSSNNSNNSVLNVVGVGGGQQPSSLETFSSNNPTPDPDLGDDKSNALVLSCPYFRNEVGGEKERSVSLSKRSAGSTGNITCGRNRGGNGVVYGAKNNGASWEENSHRSYLARGVSLLEWPGGTHWTQSLCPLSNVPTEGQSLLEAKDLGATYYRKYFFGQDHENWFGQDEHLGPLAFSIKKEKEDEKYKNLFRIIVRSTELNTIRGSILEESVPGVKQNSTKMYAKEVLEFLLPEVQLSSLKLGMQSAEEQVLKLDEQGLTKRHKVGVMYCRAGQGSEEEMYNNEGAGPAFTEFLDLIGDRVRLKGFDKYTGGLDNKDDSTGLCSIYSNYEDCEVIFHVSTLLPFTPNNRQQLMRKRHIGNDIVTIVFQEPGALPFTPKSIRSQFQHVFIVVRAINPCSDSTYYTVSVSRSREVPLFGPPIPQGAKFPKNKDFVNFLLAKVINAENATYRSEKFTTMATRTRQEYLKDLAKNYSTNTPIDPRPKFSMLQFGGSKKKDTTKPNFVGEKTIKGALSWSVWIDEINSTRVDAYLAISTDSLVIIDGTSKEPIFAIPCASVLGWNSSMSNRLMIYYHEGESISLIGKGESDELMEVVNRLEHVTKGTETQEFILRRPEGAQLGFHVQQDGVITEVEPSGCAAKSGLKQGSRLVEICKVVVATLSQDEMIEMLKTSSAVVLMVVPPFQDNTPRRGCVGKECCSNNGNNPDKYVIKERVDNGSGDLYENIHLNGRGEGGEIPSHPHTHFKQNPHRRKYETRGFSPPRSSNSSGYGTGSSSKSFSSASIEPNNMQNPPPVEGGETQTSSLVEERWYEPTKSEIHTPPPKIPARTNRLSPSKTPPRDLPFVPVGREPLKGSLSVNSTPIKGPFNAIREHSFFQRSSPHHNSFHTKLSPSRSHDMLHLKNMYGLNQPLRPYPSSAAVGVDSNNQYGLQHGRLTREHSSLGVSGENYGYTAIGRERIYQNPEAAAAIENTRFDRKVTYLTDFPLTQSHSTEHMSTIGLPLNNNNNNNKDTNALKNERVAALKSAYLEKHREKEKSPQKIDIKPIIPNYEEMNLNKEKALPKTNLKASTPIKNGIVATSSPEVKLRPGGNSGGNGRTNLNRSSTLQEDLLRLINPDYMTSPLPPPPPTDIYKGRPLSCNSAGFDSSSTDLYSTRVDIGKFNGGLENLSKRSSLNDESLSLTSHKRNSLILDSHSRSSSQEPHELYDSTPPLSNNHNRLSRLSNGNSNGSPTPFIHSRSSPLVPNWIKAPSEDLQEEMEVSISPVLPFESVLNLEARVSELETKLKREQESKEMLVVTVASLQQENRRLQQESHSTQQQFCKFKQWLLNSVDQHIPTGEQ